MRRLTSDPAPYVETDKGKTMPDELTREQKAARQKAARQSARPSRRGAKGSQRGSQRSPGTLQ